jgi:hydroxyacylglutathione hydrolase
MPIQRFVVGPMANNSYALYDSTSQEVAVVDPGMGSEVVYDWIIEKQLQLKYVLNTHGHADHIFNNAFFAKEHDGVLGIHFSDMELLNQLESNGGWMGANPKPSPSPTVDLVDDLSLNLGDQKISIISTPGHTPGSTCFIFENSVLTGDTLFQGSIGRFDFPGGSLSDIVESIKGKLFSLDSDTIVLPGHNETTTIDEEQKNNPFVGVNSQIDLSTLG